MKVRFSSKSLYLLLILTAMGQFARAQFLVDMIDTSKSDEKGLWAIYRKTDHLQISGYFQPQFQVAQTKGAKNFSGGDFAPNSDNRIMLRRARIRFDYAHFNEAGAPQAQVVFQFDGTERGVVIRDFWGRLYENELSLFSFTTGMFARPFGYEVNLSSGDRETPERGRMSQILMKTERDLGVMASFEPRKGSKNFRLFKLDIGLFNGQGLTATEEFDSYKDLIARFSIKPFELSKNMWLSAGASLLQGGLLQNTRFLYKMNKTGGVADFMLDSSYSNIGGKAPRRYRGVDAQLKISHGWGETELRAEHWWGVQTGYADESSTPSTPLSTPFYIRRFNGSFFYLVQDIVNERNQLVLKYDIYDPNHEVSGDDIGKQGLMLHAGDIRYNTFGFGYLFHFNEHLKLVTWYDIIKNESTSMEGFTGDVKDNIFTMRVQYKF